MGIVWFEDYAQLGADEAQTVDDVVSPLEPDEILSSSTTILDAVEIFSYKPNRYFYVVHVNDIVGVVFYRDLFKPLGRLAFLALALELEDQALTLCQSAVINERCWQSISDNRKRKAIELFKLRYKREPKLDGASQDKEVSSQYFLSISVHMFEKRSPIGWCLFISLRPSIVIRSREAASRRR